MAYVDTGLPTNTAPTVIFLHGNPTSSYIYRNIVPHVSPIARCIVPDLVGFGDSGKMPSNAYYVRDHIRYFAAFMDAVVPKKETDKLFFVLHDWGSAIGLDWGRKNPTRVEGVAFMEYVYEARREDLLPELRETFEKFRTEGVGRQLIIEENMFIEGVLGQFGTARGLTEAEMQHYRRPFLKKEDREPMYRFPNEIPVDGQPEDVAELVKAYWAWLRESDVPKLLFWGEPGAGVPLEQVREVERDLGNLRSVNIGPGTHYLQEDNPHLIGEETRKFLEEVLERK
ncbi:putative haloalkane dehalogenase protein [Lasiodiplodia theobromae]|uniref:Haloalkane dehalogenase n=3 Tax=Lasiodiplodia TaxID=66739 RepID=A0A5N5D7R7_9PEZI|nr:Haloalkane dehalogenase [Lasiodiplodia theobromae]KAF9636587.1 putative haloalkane dehalogenase protein [Lasiodiplodia theobromae]